MCGIAAWIATQEDILPALDASLCKHRGPDRTSTKVEGTVRVDFHRLCINGMGVGSDQPLDAGGWWLICNGEIYNHATLSETYPTRTKSDCEVLVQMLAGGKHISEVAREADGVFSLFAFHPQEKIAVVARDVFGVRGLYMGSGNGLAFCVASEMKVLHAAGCDAIVPFPPKSWQYIDYSDPSNLVTQSGYYYPSFKLSCYQPVFYTEDQCLRICQTTLRAAVKKRMMTDRPAPIGCFLSGGFDSSIVAALLVEQLRNPKDLHTFSIGMAGATDLKHAMDVATYLGTTHHQIIVTKEEMLDAIPTAIWHMETFDTTTIRAGTGMFLLSKWIQEHSKVRVVYSGEGSDELSGSYLYFRSAPSAVEYQKECLRLCEDLHRYDVLRADQATAAAGLEVRVPFLDRQFMSMYLHIDPELRRPRDTGNGKLVEKYLLRKAFQGCLPDSVLWRTKEAFSDGVSSEEESWFEIIQQHANNMTQQPQPTRPYLPSYSTESEWYRTIFEEYYSGRAQIIPYYWRPKWSNDINEPSARALDTYSK